MAWWMAAAAIGAATGFFGSMESRGAAKDANKQVEKQAKQAFERQKKEYEIAWGQTLTKYAWDQAKVEAERYLDRVAKAQYEQRMGWLTESALTNLVINREALADKYVVEEVLRARQEGIALDDTMLGLQNQQIAAMGELQNQSAQIANAAQQAQIQTSQQVAGYINAVQQRALQSSQLVAEVQNNAAQLQSELTLDAASDTIQRDIAMVAGIEESNRQKAVLSARQGGSNTAVRASQNKLQALGRQYSELAINRQKRGAQTASFNASMGVNAMQMSQVGLQMKSAVNSIKYSKASYGAKTAGLALQQLGLQNKGYGLTNEFNRQTGTAMAKFNELTLPSFDLAQRQGEREMKSLIQGTKNTLLEASMPYNEAIIFDPLEPIKGLKPEFYEPTKQYVPSMLSIGLNTIKGGFDGAMGFSYNKPGGGIGFY